MRLRAKDYTPIAQDKHKHINIFADTAMSKKLTPEKQKKINKAVDETVEKLREIYPNVDFKRKFNIYIDTMKNRNASGCYELGKGYICLAKTTNEYKELMVDGKKQYTAGTMHDILNDADAFKETLLHEMSHKMEHEIGQLEKQSSGLQEWIACSQAMLHYPSYRLTAAKTYPFLNVYFFCDAMSDYLIKNYGKETVLKMNKMTNKSWLTRLVDATETKDVVGLIKDFMKSVDWKGEERNVLKRCGGDYSEETKFSAAIDILRNEFHILSKSE